jgi:hypothetical protein
MTRSPAESAEYKLHAALRDINRHCSHKLLPRKAAPSPQRSLAAGPRLIDNIGRAAGWIPSKRPFFDSAAVPQSIHEREVQIGKWPSNALRHSYASYHLAYHQNAAALALQMGHTSQAMIFSNYREVVTRQDSERYWDIKPVRAAANVIPMAAKTR